MREAAFLTVFLLIGSVALAQDQGKPDKARPREQPAAQHQQPQRQQPQRAKEPAGRGYIPSRGPKPTDQHVAPARGDQARQRRNVRDMPNHPEAPHVHRDDTWVGLPARRDDRFKLDHPWAHGRFTQGVGPRFVYRLEGGAPSRFWFQGAFWQVAPPDVDYAASWRWNADDVVIYDDPDNPGWYLRTTCALAHTCTSCIWDRNSSHALRRDGA